MLGFVPGAAVAFRGFRGFFFQAEDGIRDHCVTGVQTCALPIYAAWAASPEYLWDACSWQGILAQAYYRPSALETWRDAARMSRYSIQEYSTRWYSYPYPQISSVEGPVPGMEYPMLAMQAKGN